MRLCVLAIGQRMPGWVADGWNDYARRFPRQLALQLREIPAGRRTRNADIDAIRELESAALLGATNSGARVIVLDMAGRQWSTEELAAELKSWMQSGADVQFLIGGPDGLAPGCIRKADARWSLGRLTLPHPLVRLVVAEQLYRAWTITQGHPYHRG